MNPKELAKEWNEIQIETHNNPQIDFPYPLRLVMRRELLLFLQVELGLLEEAIRYHKATQAFHFDLYRAAKRLYNSMA